MYDILPKVEEKVKLVPYVAFTGKISEEEKITSLSGNDIYGILLETIHDTNYKDAFGWFETTVMMYAYCKNKTNGDNGVKWLQNEIKKVLDEEDLTDAEVRTNLVKYMSRSQCEYDEVTGAWVQASTYLIRWRLK